MPFENPLWLFFALMIGHALCDYPWQGDAIAKGKNRHSVPHGIPPGQKPCSVWIHYLTAHALIHAGSVWVITGNPWLGLIEFLAHWAIDFCKCENWTNPHQDQMLHIFCKVIYVGIIFYNH
jgi:Protein of unknown function (DUF3307)